MNRIVGILLAAGRSRRMGTVKQLLPWPRQLDVQTTHGSLTHSMMTIVAASFDLLAPHCDEMIVVLGHEADEVMSALLPRRFLTVRSDPDAAMFESIRAGLQAAGSLAKAGAAMIHPADHPAVAATTIQLMIDQWRIEPVKAFMPECAGKGGHPVLIPRRIWSDALKWHGEGGLREFWRTYPECCIRVKVEDRGAVCDLDTRADYEQGSDRVS